MKKKALFSKWGCTLKYESILKHIRKQMQPTLSAFLLLRRMLFGGQEMPMRLEGYRGNHEDCFDTGCARATIFDCLLFYC